MCTRCNTHVKAWARVQGQICAINYRNSWDMLPRKDNVPKSWLSPGKRVFRNGKQTLALAWAYMIYSQANAGGVPDVRFDTNVKMRVSAHC